MLGTIALVSLGVIRIPFAPAATMFSMAVTWLALSPSNCPAAVRSLAPLASASFCAPSFILTKNGLVSVFVIRPTTTWPPPDDVEPPLPPQAAANSAAPTSMTMETRHLPRPNTANVSCILLLPFATPRC